MIEWWLVWIYGSSFKAFQASFVAKVSKDKLGKKAPFKTLGGGMAVGVKESVDRYLEFVGLFDAVVVAEIGFDFGTECV